MPNASQNVTYITISVAVCLTSCFVLPLFTDVPEIEDAQGLKREAPPTTDQSNVPKWSIIWREPTRRIQLRGIEAIFEYRPTSGDTGPLNPKFDLFLDPRLVLILLL